MFVGFINKITDKLRTAKQGEREMTYLLLTMSCCSCCLHSCQTLMDQAALAALVVGFINMGLGLYYKKPSDTGR